MKCSSHWSNDLVLNGSKSIRFLLFGILLCLLFTKLAAQEAVAGSLTQNRLQSITVEPSVDAAVQLVLRLNSEESKESLAKYRKGTTNVKGAKLSNWARFARLFGFNKVVKDPPFDSLGQPVFRKRRQYITPDVHSHSGGIWKMYDGKGRRLGTYDGNLNRIGD